MKGYLYGAAAYTTLFRSRTAEQAAFIQQINRENSNAGNTAEDWRAEFRRCTGAGGVYDFETGACDQ